MEFTDIEIVEDATSADPSEYLADVSSKLISGVLGLMGFVVACVIGLFAGNPGVVVLARALVAMICCAFIGRILGMVGEVCVQEFVTRYKSDRPQPEKPKELADLDQEKKMHDAMVNNMKKAA